MISIIAMYAISATTLFFAKNVAGYDPLLLVGFRTLSAGILFLIYAAVKGTTLSEIKKLLFPCAFIAFFSFYMSNALKFWALSFISPSAAAFMGMIEPFFAGVFAYVMFQERITFWQWIGLGISIVAAASFIVDLYAFTFSAVPFGAMMLSVGCSAYGAVLMRSLIRYESARAGLVMGLSMSIAGLVALGATISNGVVLPSALDYSLLGNIGAMILLSNIIAYGMYSRLLKRYSALFISCAAFARPLFATLLGCVHAGVFPSTTCAWSALGLLIGLTILFAQEKQGAAIPVN